MTDLDKLTRLVDNSLQDNNLTKFTCEVYKKLVEKFLENGFEIELPPMSLPIYCYRLLKNHRQRKQS